MFVVLFYLLLLVLLPGAAEDSLSEVTSKQLATGTELLDEKKFPIVYFFTMNKNACHKGLPNYITDSINQAIETQSECCEVQEQCYLALHSSDIYYTSFPLFSSSNSFIDLSVVCLGVFDIEFQYVYESCWY